MAVLAEIPGGIPRHHGQGLVEEVPRFVDAEAGLPEQRVLFLGAERLKIEGEKDDEIPAVLDLGLELVVARFPKADAAARDFEVGIVPEEPRVLGVKPDAPNIVRVAQRRV